VSGPEHTSNLTCRRGKSGGGTVGGMTLLAVDPVTSVSCRDVPWERARELAHAAPLVLPPHRVPLADAAGRTLAEDLCTPQPLPGFDTAAMDGYAVGPGHGPWRLRGTVRAGAAWENEALGAGEAVEISTGAPVPSGARAVLPLEDADRVASTVTGPEPVEGRHIRRAGEDAPAGASLAPAGTRIGPALMGLAAACGHDTLPVRPRPLASATAEQAAGVDKVIMFPIRSASGYMLPVEMNPLTGPRAFGHPGRGGSLGFADPEHGIAFGYAMNSIVEGAEDTRASALVDAVRAALTEQLSTLTRVASGTGRAE
jgi:molybdopterin molybdotransferase